MNQEYLQTVYENDEDRQLARILSMLIWTSWGVYLFVVFTGIYYKDWLLIGVTLTGCMVQIIPWVLLKRRNLRASNLIIMLSALFTVTFIATVGQGIRDLAVVAFPIILIFSGLTLPRSFFRLSIGLTLTAIGWLFFGEINNWFMLRPFTGEIANWFYLIGIILILLVTALAVDLLATNMRKNLELARFEIAQRQRAEKSLQESEARFRTLIENAPVAITLGRDGKLIYANPAYVHMHGFSNADEVVGRPTLERVAPQSQDEALERSLQRAQGLPVEMQYELIGLRRDGIEIPMLGAVTRVNLADGPANVGFFQDITTRKQAEEEVKNSERRFQALIEHGRDNISLLAADGTLLWENPSPNHILGYAPDQFRGHNIFELIHPKDQAWTRAMYAQVVQSPGSIQEGEFRLLHADGTWRWIECSATNLLDKPSVHAIVLNYRDITTRKQAEEALKESEEMLQSIFVSTPDSITVVDLNGTIKLCNQSAADIHGFSAVEQLIGKNFIELVAEEDHQRAMEDMLQVIANGVLKETPFTGLKGNGEKFAGELSVSVIKDSIGNISGFVGITKDVTERKRAEEQLRHQSTHDILTGIYNRAFFEAEFKRLERSRKFPTSIIIADVDMLKAANDTWGHTAGDDLLRRASNVLLAVFREGDVLARIGGDEFAVLLPATDSTTTEQITSRVRQQLAEHNAEHPDLPVQLSLGTATAEKNNLIEAFTLADQRMYANKAARKAKKNE